MSFYRSLLGKVVNFKTKLRSLSQPLSKEEEMIFLTTGNNSRSPAKENERAPRVKFTLASSKDKYPTVTASRLGISAKKKLELILVTFASTSGTRYMVEFRRNRFVNSKNATFIAKSWPPSVRKPRIGSPTFLRLISVDELNPHLV